MSAHFGLRGPGWLAGWDFLGVGLGLTFRAGLFGEVSLGLGADSSPGMGLGFGFGLVFGASQSQNPGLRPRPRNSTQPNPKNTSKINRKKIVPRRTRRK